jgi:hypothetical protein
MGSVSLARGVRTPPPVFSDVLQVMNLQTQNSYVRQAKGLREDNFG